MNAMRTWCSMLLAAALFAAPVATACGSSASSTIQAPESSEPVEPAEPAPPITLTMWYWGTNFDELVADFERENPGITVEIQASGFDQHHTGLASAFESGVDVPDVAGIERQVLPTFLGQVEDFTDLRAFSADDFAAEYLPWRWNEGVAADGAVVGFPTDVGGLAYAYRTDLFEAAGFASDPESVAELFADWPTFFDTARRFNEAGLDAGFLDSPDSVFNTSIGQQPFAYYDDDGSMIAAESPGLKLSFDRALDAVEEDLTAELRQFSPEWNQAMADGGFAVLAAPAWMRSVVAGTAPDSAGLWALAPVPGRLGNWGGSQLVVPAQSEHPEAAAALARYLTSPEAQLELFRENGNLPSVFDLYSRDEIVGLTDEYFGGQAVGKLFTDSVVGLPGQPAGPDQQAFQKAILLTFFDVADGLVEADEAWETALERLDEASSTE